MAEESSYPSLQGNRISTTYAGLMHFSHSLQTAQKSIVYDGKGTQTSLKVSTEGYGVDISGSVDITGALTIGNDTTVKGNITIQGDTVDIQKAETTIGGSATIKGNAGVAGELTVGGNIKLTNGGNINDISIGDSGAVTTLIASGNTEVGKLRIRQTTGDYELLFGNNNNADSNLFTIKVKKDSGNHLYIKNHYNDDDIISPLWIDRSNGDVHIKTLKVVNIENVSDPGTTPNPKRVGRNSNIIPVGMVAAFPSLAKPDGWFVCDGSSKDKNDFPELFAILGYAYGGDFLNMFKVPDYREVFLRGYGDSVTSLNLDSVSGRPPGDYQDDAFQGHAHNLTFDSSDMPGGSVPQSLITGSGSLVKANQATSIQQLLPQLGTPRFTSETRPKNITVMYCIKW